MALLHWIIGLAALLGVTWSQREFLSQNTDVLLFKSLFSIDL